uniref:Putative LAGLIDADG endonuclease n=1 Tax=Ostreobium quekettii TaxID=121088 RepID=A0A650BXH0_9CHLO|nr:putative LAGLIDADG endonuclease [Ostreobium quekettii]QGQ61972.1 putative LAGLIDADG endonuclease [Ostreobium quekettii]
MQVPSDLAFGCEAGACRFGSALRFAFGSQLLTPRALAYWFMDDGSCHTRNRKLYYVFSSQFFLLEDQKTLRDNFEISATIKKPPLAPYYVLYIRSESTKRSVDYPLPTSLFCL